MKQAGSDCGAFQGSVGNAGEISCTAKSSVGNTVEYFVPLQPGTKNKQAIVK
jgi:hypothetical protein